MFDLKLFSLIPIEPPDLQFEQTNFFWYPLQNQLTSQNFSFLVISKNRSKSTKIRFFLQISSDSNEIFDSKSNIPSVTNPQRSHTSLFIRLIYAFCWIFSIFRFILRYRDRIVFPFPLPNDHYPTVIRHLSETSLW